MGFAPALANRLLERESWARQRLMAHAGRTFALVCGPVVGALRIDDDGLLAPAKLSAQAPDLRLSVAPWDVAGLLADPTRWSNLVRAEGDAALAQTLRELALTGPLWVEQLFSRWLGPIAGQRLAGAGRHLLAFPDHAAQRIAVSVGSYLRDETSLLPRHDESRQLAAASEALAVRVDRLAHRIDAIAARAAPGSLTVP